jgi:PKD repeat protein
VVTFVTDVPITGLTTGNDGPTILGDVTNLMASVAGGTNVNYTWAFGDGTPGSVENPSHIFPDVGMYTAVVTASNSTNTMTASTVVTIEADEWAIYLPLILKPAATANQPAHSNIQKLTTYARVAIIPRRLGAPGFSG